ncbi:MAG: (d)CMP kinase, partial [Actinobacteria bacterium]|nr:(d)CMP kinase [Actinomycetota bacterium]
TNKSAKALAIALGLEYLDTGAMYRAVTLAATETGVALDGSDVVRLAESADISVRDGSTFLNGRDVSSAIRGAAVTAAVSTVAANSGVREVMRRRQRAWGDDRHGGVIEGRDIGTVVFPDALLKIYLTASARVRAERRVAEVGGDVDEMERAISERDHKDSTRADSPLSTSTDSVVVDTSGRTIDDVVREIKNIVDSRRSSARK